MILLQVYHFLSRVRDLMWRAKNRRSIKLNSDCAEDLELMLKFLGRARTGVSMNLVAYRLPTHIFISDACPHGIGGFAHHGRAWRWYLPAQLRFRASINLLEHLASIVGPWIDILEGNIHSGDCSLSLGDNTTSVGWAYKSNFSELYLEGDDIEEAAVRREVCRHHASLCLEHEIKEYSQWFPGRHNNVADSLSRDDDRTDAELTRILTESLPSQTPPRFSIRPLPSVIISWLTSLLRRLPSKPQLSERHTRTKIGHGRGGSCTASQSESNRISSSSDSQDLNASHSWDVSPWLCVRGDSRDRVMTPWLRAQSEVPFHM